MKWLMDPLLHEGSDRTEPEMLVLDLVLNLIRCSSSTHPLSAPPSLHFLLPPSFPSFPALLLLPLPLSLPPTTLCLPHSLYLPFFSIKPTLL